MGVSPGSLKFKAFFDNYCAFVPCDELPAVFHQFIVTPEQLAPHCQNGPPLTLQAEGDGEGGTVQDLQEDLRL